jgi:hypothetical protein
LDIATCTFIIIPLESNTEALEVHVIAGNTFISHYHW